MIYLNDKPINPTLFPDNTSQIWHLPDEELEMFSVAKIKWDFEHEGEFLQLAQLKMLLDKYNIICCDLYISYLPYGRQDKEVSNNSTFALRSFAKLLNSLNFFRITILDAHSNLAHLLINHSRIEYPIEQIDQILDLIKSNIVCYPDNGALEKYTKVYPYYHIYGEKVRDQATGNILSYKVIGDPKDKNVLIIDDICDGGMTFILLAKDLLANGAKEVNLFVTHGIFSKGLRVLKEAGIKRVFTAAGEVGEDHNGLNYRRL